MGHFKDFVKAFGADPLGRAGRRDEGGSGRFRVFTRKDIAERDDSLEIGWLREEEADGEVGLGDLDSVAAAILQRLNAAVEGIEALREDFADPESRGSQTESHGR